VCCLASPKILEEKKKKVKEIAESLKDAKSLIFVDYRGLTVSEVTELRAKLTEAGVNYKVYKNTLTKLALKECGYEMLEEYLVGPNAIAISDDSIIPAKILYQFAKEHETLKIKVGLIDGELYDVAKIKSLAELPTKDELLIMLAQGMLQVVRNLGLALNMLAEKKEEGATEQKIEGGNE
jgi:large subunit ribosomal protein L10